MKCFRLRLLMVALCLLGVGALMCTVPVGCTDAELCYEQEHPHRGYVQFSFDFGDTGLEKADSMQVICNRVVGLWKTAVAVSSTTGEGHFVEHPSALVPSTEKMTQFPLPIGTYKFVAINHDTSELDYSVVNTYLEDETGMVLQEVDMLYKTYLLGDDDYRGLRPGWEDNNNYGAKYMQPDVMPLYFDTITPTLIADKQLVQCHFKPKALTENIDVYLTIKKKAVENPFTIDSVQAEMAGIPISMNLSTGYMDITKTAKLPFRMERYVDGVKLEPQYDSEGKMINSGDAPENTELLCHGNIDCPGIIYNADPEALDGPGIMQLAIYLTIESKLPIYKRDENGYIVYDDQGNMVIEGYNIKKTAKMIQGKINLHYTVKEADLLKYLDGGRYVIKNKDHAELHVNADVELNADEIMSADKEGFDQWVNGGSKDIEVDI